MKKTLTIAIQREPTSFDTVITGEGASSAAGGASNPGAMVHEGLTRVTHTGERDLQLAAELPADTRGTWVINADGSMDVTWKIRSDARWHDGAPVTSADFEFAFRVRNDPESARLGTGSGAARLITSVTATGPYTFVTHWSGINIDVEAGGFNPLPKHLLESAYVANKATFGDNRYFTTEFVGAGPFKLMRWEPGSHLEFERFEGYYRGPAKISSVTIRIIPDANTMAANILAEAVDVVLPAGIDVETAMEIRQRWQQQGTGHQVLMEGDDKLEQFELMLDPTYARPVNGMPQQAVRQALFQAIDRQELMSVMTQGLSQVPNSFYFPKDENYPFLKDWIDGPNFPYRYPYDPRRAQELLASAGWTPGPDGIRVHQPSGERFAYQVLVRQGNGPLKQGTIIRDYWKTVGVDLDVHSMTTSETNDNEFLATRTGAAMTTNSGAAFYGLRLHSSSIPRPETRWTGNNRGRLSSPVVDRILEEIPRTINRDARTELHKQLISEISGKVIHHPFYWQIVPILMLKGVSGPHLVGSTSAGNIWEWDKS